MRFGATSHLALLLPCTSALRLPDFSPFLSALPISLQDYIPLALTNETSQDHELLKRQFSNTCPKHFNSCINLGAPGLCCASAAVCSADAAGHVACCPSGAACSGTVGGVLTAGTVNSVGSEVGTGGTVGSVATTSSFVFAAGATTGSSQTAVGNTNTAPCSQGGWCPTTSGGVTAADPSATTTGNGFTGGGFTIAGTSTLIGAAARDAQIPVIVDVVIQAVEYLRI